MSKINVPYAPPHGSFIHVRKRRPKSSGVKYRTKRLPGGKEIVIEYPKGPRRKGSGRVQSILYPKK